MNFDVKDIKSWANRDDVKTGDKGYFSNYISRLQVGNLALLTTVDRIVDDTGYCFVPEDCVDGYYFFLPVDAVKADKPKVKYRPFESMAEFTKVVYNLVPDYLNITGVGESFMVRRKYNGHYEKILITHLEYDENRNLISINGQSLKSLFENYDIVTDDDKIIPFGVEVKND